MALSSAERCLQWIMCSTASASSSLRSMTPLSASLKPPRQAPSKKVDLVARSRRCTWYLLAPQTMVRSEYLPHSNSLRGLSWGWARGQDATYEARADLSSIIGASMVEVCTTMYLLCRWERESILMCLCELEVADEAFLKQMIVGPCFKRKKQKASKINGGGAVVTMLTLRNSAS